MTWRILRLYPLPARESSGGAIYEDIELPPPERRDPSRPYVAINMVSSIDGKTTVGGKSSGLGSAIDRQTMRTLRSKADAVMIGANTLRAEKLSLGLDEPLGNLQPLAVIVSNSGNLPLERNLIVTEGQGVLVVVPETLDAQSGCRSSVLRVRATPAGGVDLAETLRVLKSGHAVETLLVEGGPTLNHAMISANLVDEIFLTLSPMLIGGKRSDTLTILEGGEPLPSRTLKPQLLSIHLSDNELYLRYRLADTSDA